MSRAPIDAAALFAAFDALVDADPRTRAARLDALAAESPELARRLRAMLAADGRGDGPVDAGVRTLVHALAAGDEAAPAPAPAASAGQQVGPYRLVRKLGAGGMGDVWLAQRDEAGFQQQVALKILRAGRAPDEAMRRFLQERRILAELSHPSIARFIDGGIGADGTPWYAMEYIQGVPLDVWAREHAPDHRARVRLVAEIADAVGYAQSHLVVHRDLKPSNVLVDDDGRAHLLDFGIAKLLQDVHGVEGGTTGWFALSPAYAAPEQILGQHVSTATDVYALGVMLYELLTGALPHVRDARRIDELVRQAREESIEPPARRLRRGGAGATQTDSRTTFQRIDADLDTVVMTALQRDPARRYAGAAAYADDLRRWLDGRPIAARPDTAVYRMRKFVSRHRLAVGSASGVLLALVAGFGVALWQAREARVQAARAELAATEARRATAEAEAMNRFLSQRLLGGTATHSAAGRDLTMVDWVAAALPLIDTELADAPIARSTLRHTFGIALRELGEIEAALPVLERARDEALARDSTGIDAAVARHTLGATLNRLGRSAEARTELTAAIGLLDTLAPSEHVRNTRLQAATTLLRIAASEGKDAEMLAIAERNVADRGALYGPDDPRLAVDYNNLSAALAQNGRAAEAEQAARRALALLEAGGDPPPARLAILQQAICSLAIERAAWADAQAACARADALCTQALGPTNASCTSIGVSMLRVDFARGDERGARARYATLRPVVLAGTDLRDTTALLRVGIHLAIIDRDWQGVADAAAALQAATAGNDSIAATRARRSADLFAALVGWARDPSASARDRVLADADAVVTTETASVYPAAAAALAAQLVLVEHDPAGAAQWSDRGIATLARTMPAAEAEAIWRRWSPRDAP